MKVLNMDVAGFKLAQIGLALYNKRNKRELNILYGKLADAAIDAGRRVADVQAYAHDSRKPVAERALDSVNKLVFIVYLMKNEGIYDDSEIEPVISLAQEIKAQLLIYIAGNTPKNIAENTDGDDDGLED